LLSVIAWISKFVLSEFATGEIEKRPSRSEVMVRKERRVRMCCAYPSPITIENSTRGYLIALYELDNCHEVIERNKQE